MTASSPDDQFVGLSDRFAALRQQIDKIGRVDSRVIAVTKGFGPEVIQAVHSAGLDAIGESYAQELDAKRVEVEAAGLETHFIGRIQRNKVRKVADFVDLWHSVSRVEIVREIAKRCEHRPASILIQLRAPGDVSKAGVDAPELESLLDEAETHEVNVQGLMTIGVLGDRERTKDAFRHLVKVADDYELRERSMGMSGDYLDALEAGSTMVRIGSALLGPRPA